MKLLAPSLKSGFSGLLPLLGLGLLWMAWQVSDHYPPWSSAQAEIVAGLALCLLALAQWPCQAGSHASVSGLALALALFSISPWLQFLFGQIRFAGDAWVASLYLLAAALATWASRMICSLQPQAWPNALAYCLLGGAWLGAIVVLLQAFAIELGPLHLFVVDVRPRHPPGGNLAQPNQLASLLGLGLAALFHLLQGNRIGRVSAGALALLLILAMGITQSRTPLLFMLAGLAWLTWQSRRESLRVGSKAMLLVTAAWLVAFVGWRWLQAQMLMAPMGATLESRLQAGPRVQLWTQFLEALRLQPWFGYGWNQLTLAQMAVVEKYPDSRLSEYAHNQPLDLLLSVGLPIGLLLLLALLGWLWRRSRNDLSKGGSLAWPMLLVLGAHACVEFPLAYLYFLIPFGLALGLLDTKSNRAWYMSKGMVAITSLLPLCLWLFATLDYLRLEEQFREMRYTVARLGRPMVERPPPRIVTAYTQLAAQHQAWLTLPRKDLSAAEVDQLVMVAKRFGFAPLLYRSALALAMKGRVQEAKPLLVKLRNLHGPAVEAVAMAEIRQMVADGHTELQGLLE